MKIKIFLIGSCYSGYMFKDKLLGTLANGNIELVYQHQHDSLISIMTNPLEVELKNAKSKYQWDFNHFAESIFKKDIFEKMKKLQPDYLVFDTWAEAKCPLIKINDQTYITNNYYISTSSIVEQFSDSDVLLPSDSERWNLFKRYAIAFFEKLHRELPETKVILVCSRGAEEILEGRRTRRFFSAREIAELNQLREKYNCFILDNVSDVRQLCMTEKCYLASEKINDDYGYDISSNHFSGEYYKEEYGKLQNIILSDLLGGVREKTRYFNQAVCMLAWEDFPMVKLQAKIYKDFFRVYIHIAPENIGENKKFTYAQVQELREIPNVTVLTKYSMPWGSYNELLVVLEMSDMAFSDSAVQYVHYTSNYDMPIRPINDIYKFYENEAENCSFLNNHANGNRELMRKMAPDTYGYYYFFFNADERKRDIKEQIQASIDFQKKSGITRNSIGEFNNLYKGVLWGSLTRDAYEYCRKYSLEHLEYMEDIKFTRLRTEFFFHTILFNTEKFKGTIISGTRGGKHGWFWDDKKRDYEMLTRASYEKLKEDKENHFVRKLTSENKELVKQILKDINSPYELSEK